MLSAMKAGAVFGEIALLDQERRSATVIAAEPCRLLVLPPCGVPRLAVQ